MTEQILKSNKPQNQKFVFLYALIGSLIIFNIGIFMGYMLEASRLDKIDSLYLGTEAELFDQIAQREALSMMDLDCDSLIEENIQFGDRIYEEAVKIQKYEGANTLSSIDLYHKKFDVLRALFWVNSMKIKQQCGYNSHNVVYFYQYNNPSINQESKQKVFSNLLAELKDELGNKILLVPLSGDNDIPSINLLMEEYNITELPTILIDEKIKLTDIESREDIEQYLT